MMWINLEEYWKNEKMKLSSVSSVSMSTVSPLCTMATKPSASKKRRRVCDSTLGEHGTLQDGLDTSLDHLSKESIPVEKARCSMHR